MLKYTAEIMSTIKGDTREILNIHLGLDGGTQSKV
jgi:hypothetical protein